MAGIEFFIPFMCILFCVPLTWSSCSWISATPKHTCTSVDAIVMTFPLKHECTLTCAQKSTCAATNYNTSDNTCSLLPATCPVARNDPVMVYTIFNTNRDHCVEWQAYIAGMAEDKRWATTKYDNGFRVVARLAVNGDLNPGYLAQPNQRCFSAASNQEISTVTGCQLLRVREGCTLAYVPYTAGDTISNDAVAIEGTADGTMRHIAVIEDPRKPGKAVTGYYIAGDAGAIYGHYGAWYTSQMQFVLVL